MVNGCLLEDGTFEFSDIVSGCEGVTITGCLVGGWNVGTTYSDGDSVGYEGKTYKSLQDNNTGETPSSEPTWWEDTGYSDGVVKITHDYDGCQTQHYACYNSVTGKFEFEVGDGCCEGDWLEGDGECCCGEECEHGGPVFLKFTFSGIVNCGENPPVGCGGCLDAEDYNGTWIIPWYADNPFLPNVPCSWREDIDGCVCDESPIATWIHAGWSICSGLQLTCGAGAGGGLAFSSAPPHVTMDGNDDCDKCDGFPYTLFNRDECGESLDSLTGVGGQCVIDLV